MAWTGAPLAGRGAVGMYGMGMEQILERSDWLKGLAQGADRYLAHVAPQQLLDTMRKREW